MNFFFQHIEYLLLRHDCVIVPGFGAFIATVSPARIDMEKGMIIPATRNLMFNQAVSLDDGLLANSIARKAGIPFEDARNVIVRCVAKIKENLDTFREIEIGSLGSLLLGEENNLLFAPKHLDFSSTSELGYHPVKLDTAVPDSVSVQSITPQPDCITEPDIIAEAEEEETVGKNYYQFRISRTVTRFAVMITVMAVIALTVILNPLPADEREQRASVVPVEKILPAPAAVHTETDSAKIAEPTIADSVPVSQTLPSHYLIVATFANIKEARKYAEKYSSDEYPLTAVESRKVARVAAAESDDREELRKKLNSSEITSRFPNAWIWSRN